MMSRVLPVLTTIATAIVVCCTAAHSAVPQIITYQGFLTSPGSAPFSGTVLMVFALYPAPSGPTPVRTETQTVVVSNGIFNVSGNGFIGGQPGIETTSPIDSVRIVGYGAGLSVDGGAHLASG